MMLQWIITREPRGAEAPLLLSGLFVLAAFFGATTIAAFAGIKSALFLVALLAARGAIVLRISSRRMLARAFTGALFHTLIFLSVVCHTVPPFFR